MGLAQEWMSRSRILYETDRSEIERELLAFRCLLGFGTATTTVRLQILGILRWCRREDRNLCNQNFNALPP